MNIVSLSNDSINISKIEKKDYEIGDNSLQVTLGMNNLLKS